MTAQLDTELAIIADALAHWRGILDNTIPRDTGRGLIADIDTLDRLVSKIAITRQG